LRSQPAVLTRWMPRAARRKPAGATTIRSPSECSETHVGKLVSLHRRAYAAPLAIVSTEQSQPKSECVPRSSTGAPRSPVTEDELRRGGRAGQHARGQRLRAPPLVSMRMRTAFASGASILMCPLTCTLPAAAGRLRQPLVRPEPHGVLRVEQAVGVGAEPRVHDGPVPHLPAEAFELYSAGSSVPATARCAGRRAPLLPRPTAGRPGTPGGRRASRLSDRRVRAPTAGGQEVRRATEVTQERRFVS